MVHSITGQRPAKQLIIWHLLSVDCWTVLAPITAHPNIAVAAPRPVRPNPHGTSVRPYHIPAANPCPTPGAPIPVARCPHVGSSRSGGNDFHLRGRRRLGHFLSRLWRRRRSGGGRSGLRTRRGRAGIGRGSRVGRRRSRRRHINNPVFDAPARQGRQASQRQGKYRILHHTCHSNLSIESHCYRRCGEPTACDEKVGNSGGGA